MVRTRKAGPGRGSGARPRSLGIARVCAYNGALIFLKLEMNMTDDIDNGDGTADAIAATAVISLVVFGLYLWLSGMPS